MDPSPLQTNYPPNDASANSNRKDISLPVSLDHARITVLPQSAFYIPNFISEEEERMILEKVCASDLANGSPLILARLPRRPSPDGSNSRTADSRLGPPTLSRTSCLTLLCHHGLRAL